MYFTDPETKLSATEQLETMDLFWNRMGLNTPRLSLARQVNLAEAASTYPDRSILVTPLSSVEERVEIADTVKELFPGAFGSDHPALEVAQPTGTFGKLLLDPESTWTDTRDPSDITAIRYKTWNGDIVSSKRYRELALDLGKALAWQGRVWTYVMVDVRLEPEPQGGKVGELFEQVDPSLQPEHLIDIHLLHALTGRFNKHWRYDITNEGLYKVDSDGNPISQTPFRVNANRWEKSLKYILSAGVNDHESSDRFAVRAATSALGMTV
jgi:hypothetical protein